MRLTDTVALLAARPAAVLFAVASVALFIALKRFTSGVQRAATQTVDGLLTRLQQLECAVDQLRAALPEPSGISVREPVLHGDNRARAIAMVERGDRLESVSAEIGAPVSEIELLMKVRRLLARCSA